MIKLIFGQKNNFETWKCPLFDCIQSSYFTRYQKSFEEAHLDAKIYQISSATLWNSTTVTTLVGNTQLIWNSDHTSKSDISWLCWGKFLSSNLKRCDQKGCNNVSNMYNPFNHWNCKMKKILKFNCKIRHFEIMTSK